jgi:hypothetical protein
MPTPDAFVNDCAMISTVAPEYAPPRQAPVERLGAGDQWGVGRRVGAPSAERPPPPRTAGSAGDVPVPAIVPRAVRAVRSAARLPLCATEECPPPEQGLWLAGEYFDTSSINGAMGAARPRPELSSRRRDPPQAQGVRVAPSVP